MNWFIAFVLTKLISLNRFLQFALEFWCTENIQHKQRETIVNLYFRMIFQS